MYSSFQLAGKYINYYTKASNAKGHGVHSPFVFDFIKFVMNDKKNYECYGEIEAIRKQLLKNNLEIDVEDFGAGSAVIPFKKRVVKDIAASSLKKKKWSQLLFRIAQYYNLQNIVELGTSFGITTSYLASAKIESAITTLEGSKNIAAIARKTFELLGLKNINLVEGNFSETLPKVIQNLPPVEMLFIDGNHRKEATIEYFNSFLKKATTNSVFIFDDIHWSLGMEDAWKLIQQHPSVTLTIDLFFVGLVFFKKDFKVKQHFSIRF